MRTCKMMLLVLILFLGGCAAQQAARRDDFSLQDSEKEGRADLSKQLATVTTKLEIAKKENYDLKRELELFRRTQHIDTKKFVETLDICQKEFAADILKNEVVVHFTDRGLVVTIVAEKLFISGSDDLSDGGKFFLDKVFIICKNKFPTNYIYVEGHTDNQSLAVFEWKSDWDFSFARALSVVRYFTENKGMDPLRLSASGFGQYRPRASNETKEGRNLNRRIEIIISPQRPRHVLYN